MTWENKEGSFLRYGVAAIQGGKAYNLGHASQRGLLLYLIELIAFQDILFHVFLMQKEIINIYLKAMHTIWSRKS